MDLVTLKVVAKHELLFNKSAKKWTCSTSKFNLISITKCDQIIFMIIMNLVSLKAAANHELLFHKKCGFVKPQLALLN